MTRLETAHTIRANCDEPEYAAAVSRSVFFALSNGFQTVKSTPVRDSGSGTVVFQQKLSLSTEDLLVQHLQALSLCYHSPFSHALASYMRDRSLLSVSC